MARHIENQDARQRQAVKLLKAALSYIDLDLYQYGNGEVSILTLNKMIVCVDNKSLDFSEISTDCYFFRSAADLLDLLFDPNTCICWCDVNGKFISINFAKRFGNSIYELKTYLDINIPSKL